MSEVEKAAKLLADGWKKYVALFGEPPHGTEKQMAVLLEFCPAIVRAESVGHVAQCKCCKKLGPIRYFEGLSYCALCDMLAETHPHVDDRCLPGLQRAAIIRAEALADTWSNAAALFDVANHGDVELIIRSTAATARAELERPRGPQPCRYDQCDAARHEAYCPCHTTHTAEQCAEWNGRS